MAREEAAIAAHPADGHLSWWLIVEGVFVPGGATERRFEPILEVFGEFEADVDEPPLTCSRAITEKHLQRAMYDVGCSGFVAGGTYRVGIARAAVPCDYGEPDGRKPRLVDEDRVTWHGTYTAPRREPGEMLLWPNLVDGGAP